MSRFFSILLSWFAFPLVVSAQFNVDSIPPSLSSGAIDERFLQDLNDYIASAKQELNAEGDYNSELGDIIYDAAKSTALSHQSLFKEGNVLFGNETSDYLNGIKNDLLKDDPELSEKIDIYILRSAVPNAYAQLNGFICISYGLLARVQNEAQLAFVIGHEIAHIRSKHLMEDLQIRREVDELISDRNDLTLDDVTRFRMRRSREQEHEADSLGLLTLKSSSYIPNESLSALSVLGRSHLPVHDMPFDRSIFESEFLKIPGCFWLSNPDSIDTDMDVDDIYLTHPNIKKRKLAIEALLQSEDFDGTGYFVQPETSFKKMQLNASLELIQLLLENGNFGEATYMSYCMMQIHPKSEALNKSFITSLFLLTHFKVNQRFLHVAEKYSNLAGNAQPFYYLIKSLTGRQLTTLALRYIHQYRKLHPNDLLMLQMEEELVSLLVNHYQMTWDDFLTGQAAKDLLEKIESEYDPSLEPRLNQRNNGDFYRNAFADLDGSELKDIFTKIMNLPKDDGVRPWRRRPLSSFHYAQSIGDPSQFQKGTFALLEPVFIQSRNNINLGLMMNHEAEFEQKLFEMSSEFPVEIKPLHINDIRADEVERYNLYVQTHRWIEKVELYDGLPQQFALSPDYEWKEKFDYVISIHVFKYGINEYVYWFRCHHTWTNKLVYSRAELIVKNNPAARLTSLFKKYFEDIYLRFYN